MTPWVERARGLHPDIEAARAEMDQLRWLPQSLANRMAEVDLYRLCVPRALGGPEVDVRSLVETLEALAEADASPAWCVMIGATTSAMAAWMEPDAASAIFGRPGLILAGVYAPTGTATESGEAWRVTGRWSWNSGGQNAHWLCGGCKVVRGTDSAGAEAERGQQEGPMLVFFPASAATFGDTWRTSGLMGTGSGEMSATDVLAPRAHSLSLVGGRPVVDAPLYRFPVFGLLALGIAAVASGNALGALVDFRRMASSKRLAGGRTLAERSVVQAAFASAHAEVHAARALLLAEIDAAWRVAQLHAPDLDTRARLRLAATHMTRTAAEAVRRLQDLSGGTGVFLSDPLHRRLMDAQTMTAHIMIAPPTLELAGRVLLGLPASTGEL